VIGQVNRGSAVALVGDGDPQLAKPGDRAQNPGPQGQ